MAGPVVQAVTESVKTELTEWGQRQKYPQDEMWFAFQRQGSGTGIGKHLSRKWSDEAVPLHFHGSRHA